MAPITNGVINHGTEQATAGAPTGDESKSFRNRYEYTRYSDNVKNQLIEDMLARYESLAKTHNDYVAAHQQERETSQAALQRVNGLQSSIDYLQQLLNADPFILVLIDGNGMIFHQNLLPKGEEGGKLAANAIKHAALDWARTNVPETPDEVKVVVRVYADVRSMSNACAKAGIINHPSSLMNFVHGFNSSDPLFDFIDVGIAKDAADQKVVASLKLFLFNYYCRHIFFGGSHNEQYASVLQEYMQDTQAKGRIALLEGVPFGEQLLALPLPRTRIPGVFRNTGLVIPPHNDFHVNGRGRLGSNNSLNAASSVFTPRTNTPADLSSPFGSVTSLDQLSMVGGPHPRVDSVDDSSDAGGRSWATVTRKNAHRQVENMAITPNRGILPSVHRNKQGQRVDVAMEYERSEVQRIKKLKACNQHYIGNGCCHFNAGKADKCPHHHYFTFTPVELKTLRVVARETPCKKGHECDESKCIYGHQCPFPVAVEGSMRGSGLCLNGESCRFPPSMHRMDTAPLKITKITGL